MNLKEIKLPITKRDKRIKEEEQYLLLIKDFWEVWSFKTVQANEETSEWYFNFLDDGGISCSDFNKEVVKKMWHIPNYKTLGV